MKKLIRSAASKLKQETPPSVSTLSKHRIFTLCASNVLIFLLVLGMVVSGCATAKPESVKQQTAGINYSDGINEQEAVILAQKFLIEKGLEKKVNIEKPYKVSKSIILVKNGKAFAAVLSPEENEGEAKVRTWLILFQSKILFFSTLKILQTLVQVNARTGEIVDWHVLK